MKGLHYSVMVGVIMTMFVVGCSETTTNTVVDNEVAAVSSCKKYLDVQSCVISKQPDATVRKQMEDANAQGIKAWEAIDATTLKSICDAALKAMESSKDVFEKMGCSLST